jgi:hypothetical protein
MTATVSSFEEYAATFRKTLTSTEDAVSTAPRPL